MPRFTGGSQAEGDRVTSASASDLVVIYKVGNTASGQPEPRDITVGDLLTGSGTGFTQNSIPFANAAGDLDQDNANLNFNDSTNTFHTAAITNTGDVTTTSGNIILATAGKGLQIKEGSNARMGRSTLASGTVTVANTSVTASTEIYITRQSKNSSTALGILGKGTVVASTSFIINAEKPADGTVETGDTSIVSWLLIEPSA